MKDIEVKRCHCNTPSFYQLPMELQMENMDICTFVVSFEIEICHVLIF